MDALGIAYRRAKRPLAERLFFAGLLCCAGVVACDGGKIGSPDLLGRPDVSTSNAVSAPPTYPLEVSSNGRYFVDGLGVPVLLHGDTAWSLIGELTKTEAAQYLDDCAAREFNSLIVTLVDGHYVSSPPRNAEGVAPFTTPGKFSTPNEAYFQHADWVIEQAALRGIQILLAPVYLGCCNDGWYQQVRDNNSEQDMRAFGEWVGNRYKDAPNLMFHWGNDVFPQQFPQVRQKIRAMAEGLRGVDGVHLTTYHASPGASAYDEWSFTQESWLDFNATYTYDPVWQKCQADYAFSPTTPFILFESKYENEYGTTGKQQRVQAYQALLSGAAGQFYGNWPIWHMGVEGGNWQAALADPGRSDMMHVRDLFESRAWYRLVPDLAQTVLTGGRSSGDDRAVAALTDNGETLIVYAPSRRALTIDLDALSGSDATVWWFNPRDGSVDGGTPLTSSGTHDFTPPTNADWVLVIDDDDAMLPPPGTDVVVPDPDGEEVDAGTDPPDPTSVPDLSDPDLLVAYPFSSDGSGVITDASGNGHDGSCTPGGTCPGFVAGDGQPPGAYDFAGDGNYIDIPNESAFDFTTELSVSLWMKSANPRNAWAQLVGKGDSTWGIERYTSTNTVSFTTFAPSSDNMVGSTNVFDGQWHHIAAVYDGSQKTLYVDGVVDAQKPYSATLNTNDRSVHLGFNSEFTSGQYDGLLDDVRIYSHALSQAEVQVLMVPPGDDPSAPLVVTLQTPTPGSLFHAGEVVSFSADATDTEDGVLSDSAFSWEVLLTEGGSTRTVLTLDSVRSGSFTVPVTGLGVTGTLRYEIRVTVTDSVGTSDEDSVTLDPDRVGLTFDTAPSGLILYLDGVPSLPPFAIDTLIGYQHGIEAPDTGAGNQLFTFDSWSDGGAQIHAINAPVSATSYIATYTVTELDPGLDEDGDGLLNGFEIQFGFDPFDPSEADLDSDGDSLTNLEEQGSGTDPTEADPDSDSLTDPEELALGTDPNDPDTDGDTFLDGEEAGVGTDPLDPTSFPGSSDPGLLAWYTLTTDGAGVITDSSGNGHDGSCTPGDTCPAFAAGDGQPPGAYDFAGDGNFIELPNESAFDFTTELSVSLWMKSANPSNTWAQLIGKGDSTWGIERYQSTNTLSFSTRASTSDHMGGSTNVFDGQWHHIAAVYDGSQRTLYVDGVVDAQKPYSETLNTNDLDVRLGYNSEFTSGQYDGLLDDVRIYSKPLSQTEVNEILNDSSP